MEEKVVINKISKKQQQQQKQKRSGLTVLTPELLEPNSTLPNKLSVSAFIREKKLQITRELQRRYYRAKKLGIPVENCPLPDPIWRRYQNGGIRVHDFDLNGCDNDEMLFDLAKEIVEDVESAEIGPDSGIPINSEIILPRSFLLDSIHHAASIHCLHLQIKANKSTDRLECLSPVERSRSLEGFSERYKSTLKTLVKRTRRIWEGGDNNKRVKVKDNNLKTVKDTEIDLNLDIDADLDTDYSEIELDDEVTDLECEFNESVNSNTITPDDSETTLNDSKASKSTLNFDAILSKLLDTPEALNPVAAYENYASVNEYGADGLWTFDSSALLAFGILAEEFIGRMIDAHLEDSD